MSIEDWRKRIDEIDRKLLELLNDRTRCAIEIGKLKRSQNLGIYDPDRVRQVIRGVTAANEGPLDDEGLERLFQQVIEECTRIEHKESEK